MDLFLGTEASAVLGCLLLCAFPLIGSFVFLLFSIALLRDLKVRNTKMHHMQLMTLFKEYILLQSFSLVEIGLQSEVSKGSFNLFTITFFPELS